VQIPAAIKKRLVSWLLGQSLEVALQVIEDPEAYKTAILNLFKRDLKATPVTPEDQRIAVRVVAPEDPKT
jgi:hypothetical protein